MTRPDLQVRPLTVDDAPAWVELDARLVEAEKRSEAWSAEELAEELAVPWAHLETRSRAYERPDGRLAGLAWVSARPGAWRAFVDLEVDPDEADWLGDELLAWAVDTARAAREEGDAPDITVLELGTQPNQAPREALARRHGFVPARHFHELIRDLAVPIEDRPGPEGVTVQPWDPDRSEDVRETATAAFRDHWGSFPHTAETWVAATTGATTRPDLHRVAVAAEGTVVGYLLVRAYPQDWELKGVRDAWVSSIGTLRSWRGRGVASTLLVAAMRAMRDAGFSHASLGVDTENPTGAPSLYAGHGFTHERTMSAWHLPLT